MLEAFDELGIKPVVIAGTSMGAICGACYAAGLSAAEIRAGLEGNFASRVAFFRNFASKLRGGISTLWSLRAPGIVDNVTLFEMLLPDVLHNDFSSLKIPFMAIAADFYGIEQVILDHGPLIPALAASCALPSMARPVVLGDRVLIDGGYVNPLPFDVVLHMADITVAVDVTGDTQRRPGVRVPGTFEAITGATQLLFHSLTREKLKHTAPDILVRPNVGSFSALDYFRIGEILVAAQPAKDQLKHELSLKLAACA
jgi:NTE family protein